MKSYKLLPYSFVFLVALLGACSDGSDVDEKAEFMEDLANATAFAFCDPEQPFLACAGITAEYCRREIDPVINICGDRLDEKIDFEITVDNVLREQNGVMLEHASCVFEELTKRMDLTPEQQQCLSLQPRLPPALIP
jgi:hypothetical protein